MTPLDRAIALLKDKGYRTVQQPFGIGSATYSFDAVLTAEQSLDLVLLQDTTLGSGERIRREVLAFGRSLDVLGSRRTLTLILVGQPLEPAILASLSQVCRVLPVGPLEAGDARMRDCLAVLLPLELPDAADMQGDWGSEVRRRLSAEEVRAATSYLSAAEQGEAGVRLELRKRVERALSGALS
ncbi:hypothetical protein [Mesorhizobium sp. NZP2077]|uniref:hypothetical protein n=1 Tax=Mesorhizobium sp. NZP2077 TaxID=2483404 RepID=UPI001551B523|nr:hypothetical protein [Mesorhizobium sp. NZP2077]QKC83507.1 hypothetical protein EB232_19540 [Mesorhizobium sp. NZP2077]QKD17023.1 hypothetical protein HGP13_19285 [Mesorhizobium sp. NZP2077]